MNKAPTPSRSLKVCRLRFSIKGKPYQFNVGKWDNPSDKALASHIGRTIYADYHSANFDPTLAKYKAYVSPTVTAGPTLESLTAAVTELHRETPTCHKRNVLSHLAKYGKPIRTAGEAATFYRHLCAGLKASTASNYLIVLKQADRELFGAIKPPRVPPPNPAPLLATDARAYIAATAHSIHHSYFRAALHTGCRPGELLGLRWSRVILDGTNPHLLIDTALKAGKTLGPTKNGKTRKVPLSPAAIALFRSLKPPEADPDALVFTNSKGEPICQVTLRECWRNCLVRAGLLYVCPYKLRHTFLSHLVEKGKLSIPQIASIAGNTPKVLLGHYAGVINPPTIPDLF